MEGEKAMMTRRQMKDHQRYMENREERKRHQREYYRQNREKILVKKKQKIMLMWELRFEQYKNK